MREQALSELQILDSEPEPEFDAITEAAARLMGCEISLISLIDRDRQWFKSRHNVSIAQTPIGWSFCRHAVERGETLIVEDAICDPRFVDNPLVTGDPKIRFYAGIPISLKRNIEGSAVALGTLCVIDPEAKDPSPDAIEALIKLAHLTEALLEARLSTNKLERKSAALASTVAANSRMHRQLQQAERMAGFGSWRFTLADSKVEWSPQMNHIHSIPLTEKVDVERAKEFFPEPDRSILSKAISNCTLNGESYDLDLNFIDAANQHRRVRAIGELELRDGKPEALVGVLQDTTQKHELETRLRNIANTDHLTRLANRGRFTAKFVELYGAARENDCALGVVLIDLDRFKQVNDTRGHQAGDELLRRVAEIVRSDWLRGSFAARPGGDEFVLLLTDGELIASLDATITRLLNDLCAPAPDLADCDDQQRVTASLGVALLDPAIANAEELLACADKALYRAKDAGRACAGIHGGGLIRST